MPFCYADVSVSVVGIEPRIRIKRTKSFDGSGTRPSSAVHKSVRLVGHRACESHVNDLKTHRPLTVQRVQRLNSPLLSFMLRRENMAGRMSGFAERMR
jgi:hypothetical protein